MRSSAYCRRRRMTPVRLSDGIASMALSSPASPEGCSFEGAFGSLRLPAAHGRLEVVQRGDRPYRRRRRPPTLRAMVAEEPGPGVTNLEANVCWALLRSHEVGRLAVSIADRPEIFPVNYVVDHGTVVFRTAEGTKLAGASRCDVAFEADGYESGTGEAWSVVVYGGVEETTLS